MAVSLSSKQRRRQSLFGSAEGLCFYCGDFTPLHAGTLDHMIPRVRGGTNALLNLAWCCSPCNRHKGSMTAEEFREYRLRQGMQPQPQRQRQPEPEPAVVIHLIVKGNLMSKPDKTAELEKRVAKLEKRLRKRRKPRKGGKAISLGDAIAKAVEARMDEMWPDSVKSSRMSRGAGKRDVDTIRSYLEDHVPGSWAELSDLFLSLQGEDLS
jgi:HNH endonuclease